MEIIRFTKEHIEEAIEIAKSNYEEERRIVTDLPAIESLPDLTYFAENGLGVAAFEKGKMAGFLCCYEPWQGAFDLYDGLGTFSPLHAHGAVKENRVDIYQRMYEKAGAIWAERKILTHGIALYAHDKEGIEAFFEYGFGKRCVDQIRTTGKIGGTRNSDLVFEELKLEEFPTIRDLRRALDNHLKQSPCFMQSTPEDFEGWLKRVEKGNRRTFVARKQGEVIAYLDVAGEGEKFITYRNDMMNLQGAYCRPEYRGQDISKNLLDYVSSVLKEEGYTLLGVDHESFNPTANRFWKKYFTPYTNSLVRRLELWTDSTL